MDVWRGNGFQNPSRQGLELLNHTREGLGVRSPIDIQCEPQMWGTYLTSNILEATFKKKKKVKLALMDFT